MSGDAAALTDALDASLRQTLDALVDEPLPAEIAERLAHDADEAHAIGQYE